MSVKELAKNFDRKTNEISKETTPDENESTSKNQHRRDSNCEVVFVICNLSKCVVLSRKMGEDESCFSNPIAPLGHVTPHDKEDAKPLSNEDFR